VVRSRVGVGVEVEGEGVLGERVVLAGRGGPKAFSLASRRMLVPLSL
jgi:hypothetical protein